MSEKLKSRKLWAFILTALLVVANFIFTLGIPSADVLYLVGLTASYILGQGFVDAKQQKVATFPVEDFTNSVSSIIQAEIEKTGFGKNLPMESIIDLIKTIMKQEIGKLSVTLVPDPVVPAVTPVSIPAADPVQQSA